MNDWWLLISIVTIKMFSRGHIKILLFLKRLKIEKFPPKLCTDLYIWKTGNRTSSSSFHFTVPLKSRLEAQILGTIPQPYYQNLWTRVPCVRFLTIFPSLWHYTWCHIVYFAICMYVLVLSYIFCRQQMSDRGSYILTYE